MTTKIYIYVGSGKSSALNIVESDGLRTMAFSLEETWSSHADFDRTL